MEDYSFDLNRHVVHYRRKQFVQKAPVECRVLLKNYFQCVDYYQYTKNESDVPSIKANCQEKFNYDECLTENLDKQYKNLIYRTEQVELE